MQESIEIICVTLMIVIGSTFSELTFPVPQKPLPVPSRLLPPPLEQGAEGGALTCWVGELCGIVVLTPSTHCSRWPRAWPWLCRVDLRRGHSSGHLCKRVGWGPTCLCGWAIGRGPGSTLPPPAPPDTACPGRTCYFHITNKTFEIKLAHFLLLFFGS